MKPLTRRELNMLRKIEERGAFPGRWWPKTVEQLSEQKLIDHWGHNRSTVIEITAKGKAAMEEAALIHCKRRGSALSK
jgi:hypothetical protein